MRKSKNPIIKVLVGPSNSGKSTWSYDFILKNPDYIRLNRDDMRRMLKFQTHLDETGEELITQICDHAAMTALFMGYNVIMDNMHCRYWYMKYLKDRFHTLADIEFVVMPDVELEELKRRNIERAQREGWPPVPDSCIERAHKNFQELKEKFDFETIKKKGT